MCRPPGLSLSICGALLALCGCRMGVPIHVWQSPQLQSTVGKRVLVSSLVGPEQVTEGIKQKLLASAPRDAGRVTTLIDAETLHDKSEFKLVSATDEQPNDLALAAVARSQKIDFVLRGEVIEDRHPSDEPKPNPPLKISWRLTALCSHPRGSHPRGGGSPVVVDAESAVDRYPDLALSSQPEQILTSAAVRDTFRLITPTVVRKRVQLAIPYLTPGSEQVRRGNGAALAGRWDEAEDHWRRAFQQHPTQVAALHNLALAAAAGQDFTRAKQLARKTIRLRPSKLHKETLVWIELKQRDYHKAFGLPDPPEGWFLTGDR
jgi:hypothetical protein